MAYSTAHQQPNSISYYYPSPPPNIASFKSSEHPAYMQRHLQAIPHRPILYTDISSINMNPKTTDVLPPKANPARKMATRDGALSLFMDVPVDIMYEVFSHLHPMDILTLFRTTKSLRSILYAPHARKAVWRETLLRSLHAPPPCPPYWDEIEYVSLIFDDWCQSCYKPNVEQISWLCRVRYCNDCLNKHCVSQSTLQSWLPPNLLTQLSGNNSLQQIFPYTYVGSVPKNAYGASSSLAMSSSSSSSSSSSTNESDSSSSSRTNESSTKEVYFLPRVRDYLCELDTIAYGSEDEDEGGDVNVAVAEERLERWCEERRERMEVDLAHARAAEYWHTKYAYRRTPRGFSGPTRSGEAGVLLILMGALVGMWWERLRTVGMVALVGQ